MRAIHRIQVAGALLAAAACSDNTSPSTPTQLAFVVEPNDAGVGSSITPAVVVAVKDDAGRTVWTWTDTVHLSLATGGDSATLAGATSVAAVSGTAVFDDLRLMGTGAAHRLLARSGKLSEASSRPFAAHGLFTAASVAAGGFHTCALAADGTPFCWGLNPSGQFPVTQDPLPTPVPTSLRFAAITVGYWHACGLTSEGVAYCWGDNAGGELGDGTTVSSATPRRITLATPLIALGAGFEHTCGLAADGRAYCWGGNDWGQLGDGTDSIRPRPTAVAGGLTFVALSAGFWHTCGLTADGAAYCWGSDVYGEVGDGYINHQGPTGQPRLAPTAVAGGHRFTSLTAGGGSCHGKTCGIATDGTTWCWGRSYQTMDLDSIPTALTGGQAFARMAIGGTAVCGVTTSGALYCWGQGFEGVVGNGTTDWVRTPTRIAEGQLFASVSMGQEHTCAVAVEGTVLCWGSNRQGQLGSSLGAAGWSLPVPVWKP